ncbi:hypothetical protein QTP88_022559 [Uroleucon formosanum]
MVKALTSNDSSDEIVKKISIKPHEVSSLVTKDLSNFVTKNTKIFLERSGNYGGNAVAHINVINDTTERGMKLIEEYNSILTKDEEQKQYLLQIVKNYEIKYPDSNKSTVR